MRGKVNKWLCPNAVKIIQEAMCFHSTGQTNISITNEIPSFVYILSFKKVGVPVHPHILSSSLLLVAFGSFSWGDVYISYIY